jgi:hypothetical protein
MSFPSEPWRSWARSHQRSHKSICKTLWVRTIWRWRSSRLAMFPRIPHPSFRPGICHSMHDVLWVGIWCSSIPISPLFVTVLWLGIASLDPLGDLIHSSLYDPVWGIHLALEVKTFFGNPTPVTVPGTESIPQKSVHPTDSYHRHHRKRERERNLHTKSYKAKLERLRSARLTRHNQAVKLLDMPRVQVVNDS